jgi:hypothetical protein
VAIFTSVINAILALWQILKLGKSVYDTVSEIQRKAKEERTANAIHNGDNIEAERGIGNPDAGKPSGIGEIREKSPKP